MTDLCKLEPPRVAERDPLQNANEILAESHLQLRLLPENVSLTFARGEAFDDRGVGLDAAAVHVPGGKGAYFRLHSILRVQKQDGIEIGQRLVPEQRPTLRLEDAVEPFEERAAEIKFLALFGQDGGG